MKKTISFIAAVTAITVINGPKAHARINCNHDPVCQAKRDGTSVATAAARDEAMTRCLAAVGYTQADWHARSVPAGPATKVRSCFRANGVPE